MSAPTLPGPVVHVAGTGLLVNGRFNRQRCSWCGEVLIDDDLATIAVPEGHEVEITYWPVGAWVEVSGEMRRVVTMPDATGYPVNSCMAETPTQPKLRLVPPPKADAKKERYP